MLKVKKKISVSVSEEVLENLKSAAKRENMTVNRFINKTLESYAIWDLHNSEFIPIRKALLATFLDRFTPEEIDLLAENMAHKRNKDTVLRVTSQFNVINALKTFEAWIRMTGFPYSYDIKGSVHMFIVLHDLGNKWSLYLAKLLSTTLNQVEVIPKIECTGKIFSITVDLGQAEEAKKRTDEQVKVLDTALRKIQTKHS